MLPLRELQSRFFAALNTAVAETGGDADPALLQVVGGDAALGPAARLEIYAGMYRTRLLDVLREDFPRTLACVGDDAFAALGARYLARHPSVHGSIRHLGRRFADHLATEPATPPFLADLARLEWARVEVFDAADAIPLRLADLQSIAAERWAMLTFHLVPACVVVESDWPVHRLWADAETLAAARPAPEPTTVRVWREEWSVSHAAMPDLERRAFRAVERGASFAEICAALEPGLEAEATARQMGGILMRWLEDGLLAGVSESSGVDGPPPA